MQFALDIFKKIVAYLPQLFNWWLYSSERTKKNIDVTIHNMDGSVEFWCDKSQPLFKIIIEFKNNNPFPIEVDRIEINGWIYAATNHVVVIKAFELFGGKIGKNEKRNFYFNEKLDELNLVGINEAPDNATLNLHVKAVIKNKYHCIRDFRTDLDRLMCKFINKTRKA